MNENIHGSRIEFGKSKHDVAKDLMLKDPEINSG